MSVYVQDPDLTLYHGDALETLRTLPDESVNCALTSPPFFGLRDYQTGTWEGGDEGCGHVEAISAQRDSPGGFHNSTSRGEQPASTASKRQYRGVCGKCGARRVDQQIGLEDTPDEWVARLVEVFRELRRVLRSDGTVWCEIGDSYASGETGRVDNGRLASNTQWKQGMLGHQAPRSERRYARPRDLKPKDLLLQPFMLAMALRADGWYLRQVIIWSKPNCMPESATDRCTTSHSYVLLLAKSPRYWFDADAIAEPAAWERWGDQTVPKYEGTDTASGWIKPKTKAEIQERFRDPTLSVAGCPLHDLTFFIGDQSRHEGHVYPPCEVCGDTEPQMYVNPGNRRTNGPNGRTDEMRGFDNRLERSDGMKNPRSVWTIPTRGFPGAHFATWPEALVERIIKAGCPEGGVVLDPFFGSGTTGLVARRHSRRTIGIELNADYCRMAAERLQQLSLLAEAHA